MFKPLNILDETDERLRKESLPVTFPLNFKEKILIKKIIKHLTYSQIDKYSEKYNLRPGTALAFPQLGINKRIIVIVDELEENIFKNYIVINPKIISNSTEKIALSETEGCLSVNRIIEGHVKRHARITITGFDQEGNPIEIRARELLAITFQHEIDHLNGIMFFDYIDENNPYLSEDEVRFI